MAGYNGYGNNRGNNGFGNKRSGELFVNPYHFVSLQKKGRGRTEAVSSDGNVLTGYISCRLSIKTPLVLPDSSDKKGAKYNFYNVSGKPMIPGSGIRGCIRSTYEAVTNSCLSVLSDNEKPPKHKNSKNNYRVPVYDLVRHTSESYLPCSYRNKGFCPACNLFGAFGNASRLRFTDAVLCEDMPYRADTEYFAFPRMESPKLSKSSLFYTKNLQSGFNGRYYPVWRLDGRDTEINGRKFYFHRPPINLRKDEPDNYCIAAKKVNEGTFSFRVYFDKISETELKQLLWVLSLGDNREGSAYMHKMGRGRPLGFGSVKITVEENGIALRNVNGGDYSVVSKSYPDFMDGENCSTLKLDDAGVKQLLKILNFHYLKGVTVEYPYIIDRNGRRKSGFEWFGKNAFTNQERRKIGYKQILPDIPDGETEKPTLKSY